MHNILALAAVSVVGGFFVALATSAFIGRTKAHRLPGGSLAMGLITGFTAQNGLLFYFVGGACGIAGWILFCLAFPDSSEI